MLTPSSSALIALCGLALPTTALGQWNTNYSIQRIGLTGPEHTGSAGLQSSLTWSVNSADFIVGGSNRYLGGSTSVGQDAWVWNGSTTVQIGLTGGPYLGSGGLQTTQSQWTNNAGHITGYSLRYAGMSTSNGYQDAWFWNGSTTIQIGLTGPGYTGSSGVQRSEPRGLSDVGHVVGSSSRINGVNTFNGTDAWVWNGTTTTRIGLTGDAYTGSAGYQSSEPWFYNANGQAAGISRRYTGISADNGRDAWVWNGSTTTQIGLTGNGYIGSEGYQWSEPRFQNSNGQVSGESKGVTGVNSYGGNIAWVWNGSNTTQIGLVGPANTSSQGYHHNRVLFQSDTGHVVGNSIRYVGTRTGLDVWTWNGTTTTQIGLTGPGYTSSSGYQESVPSLYNNAGHVVGLSLRVNATGASNGEDAWIWNGSTTTRINLTGGDYTRSDGQHRCEPLLLHSSGHAAGVSVRFLGLNWNGRDAWVWNGTTTTQIGLYDEIHTGSAGRRESVPLVINSVGQVVGRSIRYVGVNSSRGQDAWIFDPSTGETSVIVSSVRTSDNYAYSNATITEDGTILGSYTYFANGEGDGELRYFLYRPDQGFTDLGALVNGGLSSNGWSTLLQFGYYGALDTIVGYGLVTGQTEGQSVFVMTPSDACPADLDNDGSLTNGGTRDRAVTIDDLLFLLAAFESGNLAADLDNGSNTGTRDNAVTIDDLLYFLTHFEAGC